MKQAPDSIYIITGSAEQSEELQRIISLRGFDQIRRFSPVQAIKAFAQDPPVLVIIDLGIAHSQEILVPLLNAIPKGVKSFVLADSYDESLFLLCHDAGAKDFIVKPVADAYLVSRVIHALQEARLEELLRQKDSILVEMGVLSSRSSLFTTSYLMKQLELLMDGEHSHSQAVFSTREPLSLILVAFKSGPELWPPGEWGRMYAEAAQILKASARGLDIVGEYLVDKFAVILPKTGSQGANALVKRLSEQFSQLSAAHRQAGNRSLTITIGMAEAEGCRHYEDFLNRAAAGL